MKQLLIKYRPIYFITPATVVCASYISMGLVNILILTKYFFLLSDLGIGCKGYACLVSHTQGLVDNDGIQTADKIIQ